MIGYAVGVVSFVVGFAVYCILGAAVTRRLEAHITRALVLRDEANVTNLSDHRRRTDWSAKRLDA